MTRFETDLQVAQPVLTLVLHWMFRLRATRLPVIVGAGWDITFIAQHPTDGRKFRRKEGIRADESSDDISFITWTKRPVSRCRFVSSVSLRSGHQC